MPKLHDRRKDKAKELLRLVQDGPSTSFDIFKSTLPTDAEIKRQYKLWAETWVVPLLNELVPELKQANKRLHLTAAGVESDGDGDNSGGK